MHALKQRVILSTFISLLSLSAHATSDLDITIINHFNKPLNFFLHINPDILPNLSEHFSLPVNGEINTKIIDQEHRAYVRVKDDNANDLAYWSIGIENNKSKINGYISKGIAYSWNTQKIVFCTPEAYKQKNTCFN